MRNNTGFRLLALSAMFVFFFIAQVQAEGQNGKKTMPLPEEKLAVGGNKMEITDKEALYYIVESKKSFDQAAADLEAAVIRNGFGVLYVHNLGATLRSKGITFKEECKVFEVCNPGQAAKVLLTDMRLNMALPCRISVFTEKGKTMIGFIKPVKMLSTLSQEPALIQVAREVEEKSIRMVAEAK